MYVQLFAKADPIAVASRFMPTLIMGWCLPLFDPQGALFACTDTDVFLWLQEVTLSLYFSIAQFLPLALSLSMDMNKASNVLQLTTLFVQLSGPSISCFTLYPTSPKLNKKNNSLNEIAPIESLKQYDWGTTRQNGNHMERNIVETVLH